MVNKKVKKKCKNTDRCGHDAEDGHDQCCSCLAIEAGTTYRAMREKLTAAKSSPFTFRASGWGSTS